MGLFLNYERLLIQKFRYHFSNVSDVTTVIVTTLILLGELNAFLICHLKKKTTKKQELGFESSSNDQDFPV